MSKIIPLIIINFNGHRAMGDIFYRCLDSINEAIATCSNIKFLPILVDNNSTDDSAYIARNKGFTVIRLGKNLGYAGACYIASNFIVKNFGLTPLLICLNNDIIINSQAFCRFIKYISLMKKKLKGFIATPLLINGYTRNLDHGGHFIDSFGGAWSLALILNPMLATKLRPLFLSYCDGAFWIIDDIAYSKIGIFNYKFFMYHEDVEISLRAWREGIPSILVPMMLGVHYRSATSGKRPEILYYAIRNRIMTIYEFFGFKGVLRVFLYYLLYMFRICDLNSITNPRFSLRNDVVKVNKFLYAKYVTRAMIDWIKLNSNQTQFKGYSWPYLHLSFADLFSSKRLYNKVVSELLAQIFHKKVVSYE
jgi:GT2 family glycosyltransferase